MAAERTHADDIIDLIKQQGEMMKGMLDVMMYQQKSKEDGSQEMLGRKKLEGLYIIHEVPRWRYRSRRQWETH